MHIQCPLNAPPGTRLTIGAEDGRIFNVVVPAGVAPGASFTVSVPTLPTAAPAVAGAAAAAGDAEYPGWWSILCVLSVIKKVVWWFWPDTFDLPAGVAAALVPPLVVLLIFLYGNRARIRDFVIAHV